jgi:hypothetical protein
MARLLPGVTLAQAQAELAVISPRLACGRSDLAVIAYTSIFYMFRHHV